MDDLTSKMDHLADGIAATHDAVQETNRTVPRLAEELRAADQRLGLRIHPLVSAVAELIQHVKPS